VDILGLEAPPTASGMYFRNTVWYRIPLWEYITHMWFDIVTWRDITRGFNSGQRISRTKEIAI